MDTKRAPLAAVVCGVLAIVLGLAVPPAAADPGDQLPTEVSPGTGYDIVKYGVVPDGPCTLLLNGIGVGGCDGPEREPLRGRFDVPVDHPAGSQTLSCLGCRRVEGPGPGPGPTTTTPPPPEPLIMPDAYGLTASDVQADLEALGWHGQLTEGPALPATWCADVELPPDSIVDQSPPPGTEIGPDEPVSVGTCAASPPFRYQPNPVEIQLATVVVLAAAAPTTTTPPPAAQPEPATAGGVSPLQWILLLVLVAVLAAAVIGLLMLRRPARPRPLTASVTLRPVPGAHTITVDPPGGPRHAPSVRLTVHRDQGTRTLQEEHRGPR